MKPAFLTEEVAKEALIAISKADSNNDREFCPRCHAALKAMRMATLTAKRPDMPSSHAIYHACASTPQK